MLKSEMQHTFWITKKTVQRKFGSKEDESILSSDANLDAKIEIFESIKNTSNDLSKIIDQYQERLCVLSQQESIFGRFLKEVGKRSKTTGSNITNTGKAISYSGQQRMCVRLPLLRCSHEVNIFRSQAIRDSASTIHCMEKERTEYRAALSWMKSASSELDPDTGRGLDKFRTAQSHVRLAKRNFDVLSLNCVQKIDLLAAARCNMFSHALLTYMIELRNFSQKTASTFETISKSLEQNPKYDFTVLKELTQHEGHTNSDDTVNPTGSLIEPADQDQSLYFADEYADEQKESDCRKDQETKEIVDPQTSNNRILIELLDEIDEDQNNDLLLPFETNQKDTLHFWSKMFTSPADYQPQPISADENTTNISLSLQSNKQNECKEKSHKSSKTNPWVDLFADLDPLANPEAFDMKFNGGKSNSEQI